jgi:hypothetical protein
MNKEFPPKKISAVNSLMIRILAYSAKKIRANPAAPYSTLNPETNSDSPSAKSNGARFVSAIHVVNQINEIGSKRKFSQIVSCTSFKLTNLNVEAMNNGNKRINAILTS